MNRTEMEQETVDDLPETIRRCRDICDLEDILDGIRIERPIALFGAGRIGVYISKLLHARNRNNLFFVSNHVSEIGNNVRNIPVRTITDLTCDTCILITSTYHGEIIESLIDAGKSKLIKNIKGIFDTSPLSDRDALDPFLLSSVALDIIKSCNLNCKYCNRMNPYRHGFYKSKDVVSWIENWKKILTPMSVVLIGGEPFLHPELDEIIIACREMGFGQSIYISTNGTLVDHAKEHLLKICKTYGVTVSVSNKFSKESEKYGTILRCIKRLELEGIKYRLHDQKAPYSWNKIYELNDLESPLPFCSKDVRRSFNCAGKHFYTICENQFHRCPYIMAAKLAYKEGILDSQWCFLEKEPLLAADSSPADLAMHLTSGPFQSCKMCPEEDFFIHHEQYADCNRDISNKY